MGWWNRPSNPSQGEAKRVLLAAALHYQVIYRITLVQISAENAVRAKMK